MDLRLFCNQKLFAVAGDHSDWAELYLSGEGVFDVESDLYEVVLADEDELF